MLDLDFCDILIIMKPYSMEQAQEEASKIVKVIPKKPTGEHYELASKYVDNLNRLEREAKKRNGVPTPEEIENFVVTSEMWEQALEHYRNNRSNIIQSAIDARKKAVSHRNFFVGCSVLGIEPGHGSAKYGIYKGHNFTLKPGEIEPNTGQNKRCAERGAVEIAQTRANAITAVVIISKETNTGDGNKSHNALLPCKECRMMYREMLKKGVMREDTVICSVNDANSEQIIEERTLKELFDLYPEDVEA